MWLRIHKNYHMWINKKYSPYDYTQKYHKITYYKWCFDLYWGKCMVTNKNIGLTKTYFICG